MELQINVNLKPLKKSDSTSNKTENKGAFQQAVDEIEKKNESISNIDLLYSIFSDNPLSILEERSVEERNLIREAEDEEEGTSGTVLEEPSSENTQPDAKSEVGLTEENLKEIRQSLVDYLNQNANQIITNVDGKKIATEVIYDIGKDENVQVKNANQGFFSIIIIKGKSAQTTGSKIGNAIKGAINTLAGVQPVSTGQW